MRTVILIGILFLFINKVVAQDAIFDLPVVSATLNGKPTLQELTKTRSLSFALLSSDKSESKLTAWIDKDISVDGTLEYISHSREEKTKDKLGGYKTNYIWNTVDDTGNPAKFNVLFCIIIDPKGDRFVLEVKRGSNKHAYTGFINML